MDVREIIVSSNGKPAEAWVNWKGDVDVKLAYLAPATQRELRGKIMKTQWKAHQRMEDQVDEVRMRDFYCQHIVLEMRGLTRDGEPWSPDADGFKGIWEGNHEFGEFVVAASREISNFVESKND